MTTRISTGCLSWNSYDFYNTKTPCIESYAVEKIFGKMKFFLRLKPGNPDLAESVYTNQQGCQTSYGGYYILIKD